MQSWTSSVATACEGIVTSRSWGTLLSLNAGRGALVAASPALAHGIAYLEATARADNADVGGSSPPRPTTVLNSPRPHNTPRLLCTPVSGPITSRGAEPGCPPSRSQGGRLAAPLEVLPAHAPGRPWDQPADHRHLRRCVAPVPRVPRHARIPGRPDRDRAPARRGILISLQTEPLAKDG